MQKYTNEGFKKLLLDWPEKAISHLYHHYYLRLVNSSALITHDRDASEDIVQETIAYVYRHSEVLGNQQQLFISSFLFVSVRNKSITYINDLRKNTFIDLESLPESEEPSEPPLEEHVIALEKNQLIWEVISTFPRREREWLVMRFLNKMSTAEIAREMKVTLKAVERTASSAYKRLETVQSRFL